MYLVVFVKILLDINLNVEEINGFMIFTLLRFGRELLDYSSYKIWKHLKISKVPGTDLSNSLSFPSH